MKTQIQKVLCAAALSVVALLSSVGTAQAAIVRGSFDPAFGPLFPTLGWEGSVELYVPDACLKDGKDGYKVGDCSASDGIMRVTSASVDLYMLDDSKPGNRGKTVETLNFSPSKLFPFALNTVDVEDGAVIGIGTDYSTPVNPDESKIDDIDLYSFALGFGVEYGPRLLAFNDNGRYVNTAEAVYAGVEKFGKLAGIPVTGKTLVWINSWLYDVYVLRAEGADGPQRYSELDDPEDRRFYSFSNLSEVPEPATIVLMLGAMVALGVTTRRRSKSAS